MALGGQHYLQVTFPPSAVSSSSTSQVGARPQVRGPAGVAGASGDAHLRLHRPPTHISRSFCLPTKAKAGMQPWKYPPTGGQSPAGGSCGFPRSRA